MAGARAQRRPPAVAPAVATSRAMARITSRVHRRTADVDRQQADQPCAELSIISPSTTRR